MRSGVDPGDLRFLPRFVGVVEIWKDFLVWGWELIYPPRVRRDVDIDQRGNSRRALAP